MLTKNAIGNLLNRYRAVLGKCRLMNVFGSLAVAGLLVAGSAGVSWAEDLNPGTDPTSGDSPTNAVQLSAQPTATTTEMVGSNDTGWRNIHEAIKYIDINGTFTLSGGDDTVPNRIVYWSKTGEGLTVTIKGGTLTIGSSGTANSPASIDANVINITGGTVNITGDNTDGAAYIGGYRGMTVSSGTVTLESGGRIFGGGSEGLNLMGGTINLGQKASVWFGDNPGTSKNIIDGATITVESTAWTDSVGGAGTVDKARNLVAARIDAGTGDGIFMNQSNSSKPTTITLDKKEYLIIEGKNFTQNGGEVKINAGDAVGLGGRLHLKDGLTYTMNGGKITIKDYGWFDGNRTDDGNGFSWNGSVGADVNLLGGEVSVTGVNAHMWAAGLTIGSDGSEGPTIVIGNPTGNGAALSPGGAGDNKDVDNIAGYKNVIVKGGTITIGASGELLAGSGRAQDSDGGFNMTGGKIILAGKNVGDHQANSAQIRFAGSANRSFISGGTITTGDTTGNQHGYLLTGGGVAMTGGSIEITDGGTIVVQRGHAAGGGWAGYDLTRTPDPENDLTLSGDALLKIAQGGTLGIAGGGTITPVKGSVRNSDPTHVVISSAGDQKGLINNGTIELKGETAAGDAMLILASGGSLAGTNVNADIKVGDGTGDKYGTLVLAGGNISAYTGKITLAASGDGTPLGVLDVQDNTTSAATISGAGTFKVAAGKTFTNKGVLNLQKDTDTPSEIAGAIENVDDGKISVTADVTISQGLKNTAGSESDTSKGVFITGDGTGADKTLTVSSLDNSGYIELNVSGGYSGNLTVSGSGAAVNSGLIDVTNGTLTFSNAGTVTNASTGVIKVQTGTVDFNSSGAATNSGTIDVAGGGALTVTKNLTNDGTLKIAGAGAVAAMWRAAAR